MTAGAPGRHFGVIPARSGSKGLGHKNILELDGRPVLAYSVEAARKSALFREVFVATDDPHYADLAREAGAAVRSPSSRPIISARRPARSGRTPR